jgi:transposase
MQTDKSKVVFKDYNFNQNLLLPPSLEEMISPNHPVRVVNQVVDNLNLDPVFEKYEGGGCPAYHPRLMLKILIYGYVTNLYSSRKIEQALHENIHFMWLSGMSYPDHNTINRFRSDRLKDVLKEVFNQVVHLLIDHGHVTMKEAYVDGTKMEANAGRYTFVWGRMIKKHKEKIQQQLKELWAYAESVAKEEMENNEPVEFDTIDAEKIKRTVNSIDQALKGKDVDKEIKKKLNYAKREWPEKIERYDRQEKQIGTHRNSMSKTDPDATFMRMKEDHLKNSQLKPSYNWQITTENQYILGYTLHQNAADTISLPEHLESIKSGLGQYPEVLVGDAGYGSEENYEYLENNGVEAYLKFNYFEKEKTDKWKLDLSRQENLYYNQDKDCFYCPMGQVMKFIGQKQTTSDHGYIQTIRRYQAQNCSGCPIRGTCNKTNNSNRIIDVNMRLRYHRKLARDRLNSEKGKIYRSKRPVDVEPVFGMIKYNRNYRRFLLRGLEKVQIEAGLLSIAHNLKKMAS